MFSLCSGRRQDAMEKLKATQQVAPSAAFRGDFTTLLYIRVILYVWRVVQTVDACCLNIQYK